MALAARPRALIRAMTPEDLDAVMAVEVAGYPYPWSRGIFEDCLRVGYYCRVLECGGAPAGHLIISMGAGEAHLLNLCIAPAMQGRGFGRRLLGHALHAARTLGCGRILLEVRPSNWRALRLYQAAGFETVGRRRDYYPADHGREDAIVLAKTLLRGV